LNSGPVLARQGLILAIITIILTITMVTIMHSHSFIHPTNLF
jgi:hypothetical protein